MILKDIQKKIAVNFTGSVILIALVGGLSFYLIVSKKAENQKIATIKQRALELEAKALEYQSQAKETEKYIEVWKTIPDNKKGIDIVKIEEANILLNKLSEKYYITNQSIKISPPENLSGGAFDRKSFYVTYVDVNIACNAIDDIIAVSFLSDFLNSLDGYVVTTNVDIKKNAKYTDQQLADISSGKSGGAVLVKFEFAWYFYRKKEENSKSATGQNTKSKSATAPLNNSPTNQNSANSNTDSQL